MSEKSSASVPVSVRPKRWSLDARFDYTDGRIAHIRGDATDRDYSEVGGGAEISRCIPIDRMCLDLGLGAEVEETYRGMNTRSTSSGSSKTTTPDNSPSRRLIGMVKIAETFPLGRHLLFGPLVRFGYGKTVAFAEGQDTLRTVHNWGVVFEGMVRLGLRLSDGGALFVESGVATYPTVPTSTKIRSLDPKVSIGLSLAFY